MRVRSCIAASAFAFASLAGTAHAEDIVVKSFDGTPIVAHWFPNPSLAAGERAPVVLNGPGWSQPGESNPAGGAIKRLHDQGYNVLTWDPRGFGVSGGEANINSPRLEGRDVRALIDQMAREPEVQLDRMGDPRVAMTGGSYGGGIQLSTAGIDRRLDALVPVVSWHSLETSLYKDRTFKQGWNSLLYSAGLAAATGGGLAGGPAGVQTGGLDPHITSAFQSAAATGNLSAEDERWFRDRGPGDRYIRRITAPTMVVGGTVDTLFPLDEDVKIFRLLRARGIPAKLFWFCGGHGQCAEGNGGEPGSGLDVGSILGSGGGDPRLEAATAAWLAHYLKGDESVPTGPAFEFRSDDGRYRVARDYPVLSGPAVRARGSGRLTITAGATSGSSIFAAAAPAGGLDVPIRVRRASNLLGPPKVAITYRGTGTPRTARIFAQLISVDRNVVVGNQSLPIPVTLDGRRHRITRRLVPITSTAKAGARYRLQLVAGSALWATQRANGTIRASRIDVEVPVAAARGLGPSGRRCTTPRRYTIKLPAGLRERIAGGRILVEGRRVASLRAGGKGARVRFGARATGTQRLRLVLRLSDGRTVRRTATVHLCGAAA